ncbi:MAG TPA: MerR family transcriptional regulator [Thermoanaerobaculia bacterium]|nr:MerR family transcriptional regulator [Thermoanaerobaculia bacterium]
MGPLPWKVGELAKRTGVSVRTLHYYDELGLLVASHHTAAGYRLYTGADLIRLQQIKSLRNLGYSLEEIRQFLSRPNVSPEGVLQLQIARLKEQIGLQQSLCDRLEGIALRWRSDEMVSTEEFLKIIEVTNMLDKYYTPEQMEELKQRREALGDERMRQAEGDWQELMAQVQAEMDKGTDPADERVQQLAGRWMGLIQEFTGGNPGIEKSLGRMYREETAVAGMDTSHMQPMMEYVGKAMAAAKKVD